MVGRFRVSRALVFFACLSLSGCSASLVGMRWSAKQTPIGRIHAGDTGDAVIKQIGQPTYVITQPAVEGGHARVEWHYPRMVESEGSISSTVEPLAQDPVSIERQSLKTGSGTAEYVVVFEDGKVLSFFERKP